MLRVRETDGPSRAPAAHAAAPQTATGTGAVSAPKLLDELREPCGPCIAAIAGDNPTAIGGKRFIHNVRTVGDFSYGKRRSAFLVLYRL